MLEVLGHALDAEVVVLHGRGSSTGPAVPFRALTEALMAAARTVGPDIPAQLGPYRPVLGRLVPEWADPAAGAGEASVLVLGEAILRLTALIGRGRGCVLALDDLHEADPETLAVVEYVAGNLSGLPVAVLVTMRTEAPAASAFADAVCSRGDAEPVTLSRLDTDGVRELVLSCLDSEAGAVPDAVVARLLGDSAGNPFVIEELLHSMVSAGELVHGHEGWRLDRMPVSAVPPNLVRVIGARAERLGAEAARLLSVAAVLGRRFPLSVVQSVLGLDDSVLMDHVQSASDAQLLCPDDVLLGWYAFQHPLTADALCRRLSPDDTTTLSRQAAKVIADTRPDLPDEWLHLAIRLRTQADDPVGAVRLYLESARRAVAAGATGSAIAVLDEARAVLGEPGQDGDRRAVLAELLEALLFALAEAGQFDRALEVADHLTLVSVGGDGERRIGLHLRLAWAAQVAGRWAEGDAQVAAVRGFAPGVATEEQLASLDAVDAYLAVQGPAADRVDRCRTLARSAVERAERAGLPSIACQAWYAVGFSTRDVDLAESDASFRRVLDIATEHDLVTWRNYALVGLGSNAWLGDGDRGPLLKAREEALRTGTISLAHNAAAVLGLTAVLHGDFEHASAHLDTCIAETRRMKLVIVTRYSLMAKAVLAAHRGRRDEMSAALLEFGEHGGEGSEAAPLAHGLGRGFGALLQEDRAAAELEMAAVAAEESRRQNPFHLAGSYGLALLLDVLAGRADQRRWQEVSATSVSGMRWNRHFVALAAAVLAGRRGDKAGRFRLDADGGRSSGRCSRRHGILGCGWSPRRPSPTAGASRTSGCVMRRSISSSVR